MKVILILVFVAVILALVVSTKMLHTKDCRLSNAASKFWHTEIARSKYHGYTCVCDMLESRNKRISEASPGDIIFVDKDGLMETAALIDAPGVTLTGTEPNKVAAANALWEVKAGDIIVEHGPGWIRFFADTDGAFKREVERRDKVK